VPNTSQVQRSAEEAVSYGVGKRIRIEILSILHEGICSPSELSELLHLPLSTVSHHVTELAKSGCIEYVTTRKVRNAEQHFYRGIVLPNVSDEEAEALPDEEKQQYAAVILQAIMAESMSALWAGKLVSGDDRKVNLLWDWLQLDELGRDELAAEQLESWDRITEIAARSANRRAETGEEPRTVIAAPLG
jgi:DNA-binding transcriptional ArsR family regulator